MTSPDRALEIAAELDALGAGTPEYAMPEVISEGADMIRELLSLLAAAWEQGVAAKSNSSSIFDSDVYPLNPYRQEPTA